MSWDRSTALLGMRVRPWRSPRLSTVRANGNAAVASPLIRPARPRPRRRVDDRLESKLVAQRGVSRAGGASTRAAPSAASTNAPGRGEAGQRRDLFPPGPRAESAEGRVESGTGRGHAWGKISSQHRPSEEPARQGVSACRLSWVADAVSSVVAVAMRSGFIDAARSRRYRPDRRCSQRRSRAPALRSGPARPRPLAVPCGAGYREGFIRVARRARDACLGRERPLVEGTKPSAYGSSRGRATIPARAAPRRSVDPPPAANRAFLAASTRARALGGRERVRTCRAHQPHRVPRAAGLEARLRLGSDDVVGRSDQIVQRPCRPHVVAQGAKRLQ